MIAASTAVTVDTAQAPASGKQPKDLVAAPVEKGKIKVTLTGRDRCRQYRDKRHRPTQARHHRDSVVLNPNQPHINQTLSGSLVPYTQGRYWKLHYMES